MKRKLVPMSEEEKIRTSRRLREGKISIIKNELMDIREGQDKLIKLLREKEIDNIMRRIHPIGEGRNNSLKHFREMERSTIELQALTDVQDQFDSLIHEMMKAKIMIAAWAGGADEVELD
jgi:hypothetical protein